MGRKPAFVLLALPSTALAPKLISREHGVAPGNVGRVLKALPRSAAFPEWMRDTAKDRSALPLRPHYFFDNAGREFPSAAQVAEMSSLLSGQTTLTRVPGLHQASIGGVLAEPQRPSPFHDRDL